MLLLPLDGAFLVIFLAVVLVKVFALIDATTRSAGAFAYAGKQTKNFWLVVLALAVASTFASFLTLVGLVAALVYLLDVRPALVRP